MVILERPRPADAVNQMPNKKNGIIVYLEDQIHARRQEIKGLSIELQMLETLEANHLMDRNAWIKRTNIVDRMLELNSDQYLDRRKLRPHKRATEIKGKSPFKQAINRSCPKESTSGIKKLPTETRAEPVVLFEETKHKKPTRRKDPLTSEITQIIQQLTDFGIQKREQKLTLEEYRQLSKPLGHRLHELELQVKQNRSQIKKNY